MGKSLGNAFTLHDIVKKGYSPLALRYFYFGGHYRSPLNFTWEGLDAATTALKRIKSTLAGLMTDKEYVLENGRVDDAYKARFIAALEDDLNMPLALSVLHALLQDTTLSPENKAKTALNFDEVFGFNLGTIVETEIPAEILVLANEREAARKEKNWSKSDELRMQIEKAGYTVKDTSTGPVVTLL